MKGYLIIASFWTAVAVFVSTGNQPAAAIGISAGAIGFYIMAAAERLGELLKRN